MHRIPLLNPFDPCFSLGWVTFLSKTCRRQLHVLDVCCRSSLCRRSQLHFFGEYLKKTTEEDDVNMICIWYTYYESKYEIYKHEYMKHEYDNIWYTIYEYINRNTNMIFFALNIAHWLYDIHKQWHMPQFMGRIRWVPTSYRPKLGAGTFQLKTKTTNGISMVCNEFKVILGQCS